MFDRIELLIGKENLSKIKDKKVLIIGLGGVGGYTVESLVRSGVENITLVDYDKVDETNKNRQLIALTSTIGKLKTECFKERIIDINKNCNVKLINKYLDKDNVNDIINDYDFVVDACDSMDAKKAIIKTCISKKIKFISCMGTGKKLNPTKLKIMDIRKTNYDPVAKIIRKFVKDENIKEKVIVLSSDEQVINSNNTTISSMIFVPAVAGLLLGNYVIRSFIEDIN